MDEIPTKPYVLRALFDWCVDNGYTPHLAVKVDVRTQVPLEYAKGGEITLNIAPTAVHKLQMGNDLIEFSARFGGVARQISVPVNNVFAIYARETGHGMTFEVEAPPADRGDADAGPQDVRPSGISVVPSSPDAGHDPSDPPRGGTPQGAGKPTLRRIK
jgi:stringent starvation protein B